MNENELIEITKDSLARVLSFFSRVDTLLSVLLAINLGLLATLAANIPAAAALDGNIFFAIAFVLVSSVSFYHLYKCAFPKLDGGYSSLIYFRAIGNKTELEYKEELRTLTEEKYLDDLLEQTWRNSKILKEKFDHIRLAFIFMLISIIPWLIAFLIFASKNTDRLIAK